MKIRFLFAFAAVLSAIGFSSNVQKAESAANFSGKCAISSFENAFRQSKAVFLGEVVEDEKQGDDRVFIFKVEKYWKGANAKNIEIQVYETARYQAWFKTGGKYLVYAAEDGRGILRVGRCSRSRDEESAAEDLRKLGEGKIPR